MSHLNLGPLGAYNSLTDKHLAGYFNNIRIRRHLQKVGLISRSGRIVPEKEYRYRLMQRAQQKHVRECLAQAVFYRVLEMERLHQTEIKRKLEDFARRERVHKIKLERSNRYEEDAVMILSPRPPSRPKNGHTRHSGPEAEPSDSTDSLGSSRPNTAPGKMQRPVRLKPLNSTSTPGSTKRNSSHYRSQESSNDTDQLYGSTMERDVLRHLTLTDFSSNVSPYRLPVINNYVVPVPPLFKRKENGQKVNGALRGRRLRPSTTPGNATDPQDIGVQRVVSRAGAVLVKMVYFGKSVHLSHDLIDVKDEVKVFQQHCGGENLCVYKGKLIEGQSFQFFSRRHRGFPFSLTFFLNGLQVERLSSCCEFKHRKSSRLGGRHANFGFSGVEGAAPCYRCIIAIGLDKKPSPPKRAKEEPVVSKEVESKPDTSQSHEVDTKEGLTQEDKPNSDYEEEFEADDEGPMDDDVDNRNDLSHSPSGEAKQEIRTDKKDKNQGSDSEAGHSDKKSSSSMSLGLSSSSSSEEEESSEEEKEEEIHQIRSPVLSSENDMKAQEETQEPPGTTAQVETQEPPETTAQEETQESPGTAGQKETQESPGIAEQVETQEHGQQGEEVEEQQEDQKKAESVQEKLAKAFLNSTDCTSEPELSDTTTEEEEQTSDRSHQTDPGAEPEDEAAEQPESKRWESSDRPPEQESDDKEQFKSKTPESETNMEANREKHDTENGDEDLQTREGQDETEMEEEPGEEHTNSETGNQEEEKGEENEEDAESNSQSEISEKNIKTEILGDSMSPVIKMQKPEVPEEPGQQPRSTEEEASDAGLAVGSGEWNDNTEEIMEDGRGDGSTKEDEVKGEAAMDGSKTQYGGTAEDAGDAQSVTEALDQEVGTNQEEHVQTSVTIEENTMEKGGEREAEYPSENYDETKPEHNHGKEEEEVDEGAHGSIYDTEHGEEKTDKTKQEQDEDLNPVNTEGFRFSAEAKRVEIEAENGEMAPSADQEATNQPNLQEQLETPHKEGVEEEGGTIQSEMQHDINKKEERDAKQNDYKQENDQVLLINQEEPNEKEDGQAGWEAADKLMGGTKSMMENGVQDEEKATEHKAANEEVQQDQTNKEGENDKQTDEDHEEPEPEPLQKLQDMTEEEKTEIQHDTANNNQRQDEQERGDYDDGNKKSNQTPEEKQETISEDDEQEEVKQEEIHDDLFNNNAKEVETEANQIQEVKQDDEGSNYDQIQREEPNQTHMNKETVSQSANNQPEIQQDTINEYEDVEQEHGNEEKEPNLKPEINQETTDQEDPRENEKKNTDMKSQHETIHHEGAPENAKCNTNNGSQHDEELIKKEGEEDAVQIEMQQDVPNKPQQNEQDEKEEAHGIPEINQESINKEEEEESNNETQQDAVKEDQQKEKREREEDNQTEIPGEAHNDQQDEYKPEVNQKTIHRTEKAKYDDHENEESKSSVETSNRLVFTVVRENLMADAAEEVKNVSEEGSISLSEESQPIDKVLALKGEDSVTSEDGELIVAPRTDHGDLVRNWVNVHQASRYFETFVEPLEDMDKSTTDKTLKTETEVLESDWSNDAMPMSSKKQEEATESVFGIEVQEDNVLSMSTTSITKHAISQDS